MDTNCSSLLLLTVAMIVMIVIIGTSSLTVVHTITPRVLQAQTAILSCCIGIFQISQHLLSIRALIHHIISQMPACIDKGFWGSSYNRNHRIHHLPLPLIPQPWTQPITLSITLGICLHSRMVSPSIFLLDSP